MLKEITYTNSTDIRAGDIIEIGGTRKIVTDYGKSGWATRHCINRDGRVEEREFRCDGLYLSGNHAAFGSSSIFQLHLYGCKAYREAPEEKAPQPIPEKPVVGVTAPGTVEIRVGDVVVNIDVRRAG